MKLLIASDGSECANVALDDLRRAGLPENGEAIILSVGKTWSVWSEDASPRDSAAMTAQELGHATPHRWVSYAIERIAPALRDAGLCVSPLVCEGDPKRILVEEAQRWDADCIFVGAKGRSRWDRFSSAASRSPSPSVHIALSKS